MAAIAITVANVLPSAQAQIDSTHLCGATALTQGMAVYKDAAGLWQQANANGSVAAGSARGIAVSAASPGQIVAVCTYDPSFTVGGALVAGVAVITGLAGALNPMTDAATGWFTNVMGVPISVTAMFLNPNGGAMAHA